MLEPKKKPTATATIRSTETRQVCGMEWLLDKLYEGGKHMSYFSTGTGLHEAFDATITGWGPGAALDFGLDFADEEMFNAQVEDREVVWTKSRPEEGWRDTFEELYWKWFNNVHPDGDFQQVEFRELSWPPQSEVWIEAETDEFYLKTQLDALYWSDDGVATIVDWKTGANKGADDRQLHVYWWGVRQMGLVPEDQEMSAAFYYVDHQEYVPAKMPYPGDDYIEAFIAEAERKRKGPNYFYEPSWKCKWCAVADVCPAWDDNDSLPWPELMRLAEGIDWNGVNE